MFSKGSVWNHPLARQARRSAWGALKRRASSSLKSMFSRKRARVGTTTSGGTVEQDLSGFGFAGSSGFSIRNMKARNSKRRKYSRKMKKRAQRRNKIRSAGIAGKLLSAVYKRSVNVNEMELGRGRLCLFNAIANISGTSTHILPLHIFDITDVSTTSHTIGAQLQVNRGNLANPDAIQYYFQNSITKKVNAGGEESDLDVDPDQYTIAGSVDTAVSTDSIEDVNVRKWYQHDVKVDLMMYGQNKQDTLYRVDVVMFDPKFVELMYNVGSTTNQANTPTARDWNQFWHSLIIGYTQNPLVKRNRGNFMKILKSYKFKIPETSADYQQTPCVKTKIRVPMNRVRNRYWHKFVTGNTDVSPNDHDPEAATTMNEAIYDGIQDTATAKDQAYGLGKIDPRKRVFLMIRATNCDTQTLSETIYRNINSGEEPTYDLTIKTKFSVLP